MKPTPKDDARKEFNYSLKTVLDIFGYLMKFMYI